MDVWRRRFAYFSEEIYPKVLVALIALGLAWYFNGWLILGAIAVGAFVFHMLCEQISDRVAEKINRRWPHG